ncbi:MAG: hypothetical protein DRP34_05600 [Thermodesulfobacteriota bacterium]|nr:MAG: hypothetical protein DRP34_05600 [Thermodesulfobacteriota bacterium]
MKNMVKGLEIKDLNIFADNVIKMIIPFTQVFLKTDGVFSEVDDAPYVPQSCSKCHQGGDGGKSPITCTCCHYHRSVDPFNATKRTF